MGIGSNKRMHLMAAGAFLAATAFAASSVKAADYNSGIWRVLRAGHFSGPMRRNAHILPVKGDIAANGTHYSFGDYRFDSKYSGQSEAGFDWCGFALQAILISGVVRLIRF